jgi:hypothetical protein
MQTAQIYINDRNTATETAVPFNDLLPILRGWNKVLLQQQKGILDISKTDANAIYTAIQPLSAPFTALLDKIHSIETTTINKNERLVFSEVKSIFVNLGVIFEDIETFAKSDEIDKNSADFQHFLVDMSYNIAQNDKTNAKDKRVFGKDALFALFD